MPKPQTLHSKMPKLQTLQTKTHNMKKATVSAKTKHEATPQMRSCRLWDFKNINFKNFKHFKMRKKQKKTVKNVLPIQTPSYTFKTTQINAFICVFVYFQYYWQKTAKNVLPIQTPSYTFKTTQINAFIMCVSPFSIYYWDIWKHTCVFVGFQHVRVERTIQQREKNF